MKPLRRPAGWAAVLLAATCLSRPAHALEPERPGQGSSLTQAVVAQGKLWTLTDSGVLSSTVLDSRTTVRVPVAGPVLGLCVRAGHLEIAIAPRGRRSWTLQSLSGGTWSADGSVDSGGDGFVALDCAGSGVSVATSRRLITTNRGAQHVVHLSKEFIPDVVASAFGTPLDLFVGINAGEWGGGLRRIDRRTGAVTIVAKNASGALCGGPLNTDCDPVTDVARDPWDARCILVAIGLEHMGLSHGRVDEVCGSQVRRVYHKELPFPDRPDCRDSSGESCASVAFYGLVTHGEVALAAGNAGIYRIRRNGSADYSPLPKFVSAGDISLSYDVPGFVLVFTDVNERRSVSGSVPLLVPR